MKKKNRILIATLMAFAVTGASTYAYFTSTSDITANTGSDNPLRIDITNGTVNVTGVIGDGGATPNWTYDVATGASDKDRSPDIDLNGSDTGKGWTGTVSGIPGDTLLRAPIGTGVSGEISNARPGDAFILGGAAASNKGLVVTNNSSLTVKVNVGIKDTAITGTGAAAYVTVIDNLQKAGWKLFINSTPVNV